MPDGKSLVITGGIGTGKSAVSGFLGTLGWSVVDADRFGHAVLTTPEVVARIEHEWPEVVVGHQIDRKGLGELVFADPVKLELLEAITHPLIQVEVEGWLASIAGPKAVEVSVPHTAKPTWGSVVVVDSPEPVRVSRLMERGLDREAVAARMAAQPRRQEWLQLADFVVSNSGSFADLERAVARLSDYVLDRSSPFDQ